MGSVGLNNVPARVQSGLAPRAQAVPAGAKGRRGYDHGDSMSTHIEKARLLLPNFSPDGPKVGVPIIFVWYNAEGMRR
jgi:hypothetical protein